MVIGHFYNFYGPPAEDLMRLFFIISLKNNIVDNLRKNLALKTVFFAFMTLKMRK